jgi:DNA-binding response OmpR family regulator
MFAFLHKATPDLILLDIMMPEMNGFEALKLLKNDGKSAAIPVVFLTAHIDEETESRGFGAGADGFISKPFSAPALLGRVNTFFREVSLCR